MSDSKNDLIEQTPWQIQLDGMLPNGTVTDKIPVNGKLYKLNAFWLPSKALKTQSDILKELTTIKFLFTFTSLEDELRKKMLLKLNPNSLSIDINNSNEELLHEAIVTLNLYTESIESITTNKNIEEFKKSIEAHIPNILTQLRENFLPFVPLWRAENKNHYNSEQGLVPYTEAFPLTRPIIKNKEGKIYILDDMYCVNPMCNCQQVTCVIIEYRFKTEPDVTVGGFRYQFEHNRFKPMEEIKKNINAKEWFKQFALQYPLPLTETLKQRYFFIRNQ